jgi:hypothetical protein
VISSSLDTIDQPEPFHHEPASDDRFCIATTGSVVHWCSASIDIVHHVIEPPAAYPRWCVEHWARIADTNVQIERF